MIAALLRGLLSKVYVNRVYVNHALLILDWNFRLGLLERREVFEKVLIY